MRSAKTISWHRRLRRTLQLAVINKDTIQIRSLKSKKSAIRYINFFIDFFGLGNNLGVCVAPIASDLPKPLQSLLPAQQAHAKQYKDHGDL